MRQCALVLALALTALAIAPAPAGARGASAAKREPVVVELFTAQGCSDCPQANELLMKLADDPGVIALTFPVDYWDYLGWRDTFAKPEFGERQRIYMKAMKLRDVYTPQFVVDGERQLSGVKSDEVEDAVHDALQAREPDLAIKVLSRSRVQVGQGTVPPGGGVVWLVRYDAQPHEVEVKKGDNKGRKVRQGQLVRQLSKLGPWRGSAHIYRLPKAEEANLKSVVIVQSARTGRIIAARRL